MLAVRIEIPARGLALPFGNQVNVGAVGVHDEDLVARVGRPRGLKDQALAVGAEVCLGVLATERQLLHVAQVNFPWVAQRIISSPVHNGAGTREARRRGLLLSEQTRYPRRCHANEKAGGKQEFWILDFRFWIHASLLASGFWLLTSAFWLLPLPAFQRQLEVVDPATRPHVYPLLLFRAASLVEREVIAAGNEVQTYCAVLRRLAFHVVQDGAAGPRALQGDTPEGAPGAVHRP